MLNQDNVVNQENIKMWRSLWSRSKDAGFEEAKGLHQKIFDEEYIISL